jgi:hypothetical protein
MVEFELRRLACFELTLRRQDTHETRRVQGVCAFILRGGEGGSIGS